MIKQFALTASILCTDKVDCILWKQTCVFISVLTDRVMSNQKIRNIQMDGTSTHEKFDSFISHTF